MKEIMFKICELCGDTYHVNEMVENENWCIYCDDESPSEEGLS